MQNVRGLHTVHTVKWALEEAPNRRAKIFDLLAYARLTDEARAYLISERDTPATT